MSAAGLYKSHCPILPDLLTTLARRAKGPDYSMANMLTWLAGPGPRPVFKTGRTTGPRAGLAQIIQPSVHISYPGGVTLTGRALSITRLHPAQSFAESGDSGSLVIDPEARAVGLITAIEGPATYTVP